MSHSHFDYHGPTKSDPGPNEVGIIVYGYLPSATLPIIAIITFAFTLAAQVYYAARKPRLYRTFHILMAMGSLTEIGGYATRLFSHYQPFNLAAFIASFSMIVMAPVIYTAAVDFTLNMLVEGFGPETRGLLLLPPRWVIIIFISTDVLSVLVQTVGAGLVGASTSAFFEDEAVAVSYEQAGNIMIAGLALQIFAWVVFIAFLLVAMVRAYRFQNLKSRRYDPMRWMLWAILFSALMLIWRAIFRCTESATGYLNGPATNEPMFACFEYLPVILAVGLWSIVPPSRFVDDKLPGSEARARRNELENESEPKLEAVRSDETEASSRV